MFKGDLLLGRVPVFLLLLFLLGTAAAFAAPPRRTLMLVSEIPRLSSRGWIADSRGHERTPQERLASGVAPAVPKASLPRRSLGVSPGVAEAKRGALSVLEGTFQGVKNHVLILETQGGVQFHIPLSPKTKILSADGSFSWNWVMKGDGIRVRLNPDGTARQIRTFVFWTFGTAAFGFPRRLTLLEGPQFFTNGASLYLNGRKISNPVPLESPDEVLVRFDSLQKKTVGVWGFDRDDAFKTAPGSVADQSWVALHWRDSKLLVHAETRPGGRLYARILGGTRNLRLGETKPGLYETAIGFPRGVNLPKSYLEFEWIGKTGAGKTDNRWIYSKPVSFYSRPPEILVLGPAPGSKPPENPPAVFAVFNANGSPLALNGVRLVLDDRNVTPDCYVSRYLVFYAPESLSSGLHRCVLSGQTAGGRGAFHEKWSFHVK